MMLQIRMGHISSPPFWRYSITKVPLNALSGTRQASYLRLELSVDRAVPCSMLPGIAVERPIQLYFSSFPWLKLELLLPFGRRRSRGQGLAEKFPRAIIRRMT